MNWSDLSVSIHWQHCRKRRWPAAPRLDLGSQIRRKHCHVLLYWWAGHGERSLPTGRVQIKSGVCHWARPGWTYNTTQDPTDPLGVTAIHFDLLDRKGRVLPPDALPLPPEILNVRDPLLLEHVVDQVIHVSAHPSCSDVVPESAELAAVTQLFRGLLMTVDFDTSGEPDSARQEPMQQMMREAAAFIRENVVSLPPVWKTAQRWGYSRSHFCRAFRAANGVSPQEYAIAARVELASDLLGQSALSITEIAAITGYSDVFHFSKQFKQRQGVAPSAYRCGIMRQ